MNPSSELIGELIEVLPASLERFADVASLLAPRNENAPACWCLTYRLTSSEFSALRGQERPAELRALPAQGQGLSSLFFVGLHHDA